MDITASIVDHWYQLNRRLHQVLHDRQLQLVLACSRSIASGVAAICCAALSLSSVHACRTAQARDTVCVYRYTYPRETLENRVAARLCCVVSKALHCGTTPHGMVLQCCTQQATNRAAGQFFLLIPKLLAPPCTASYCPELPCTALNCLVLPCTALYCPDDIILQERGPRRSSNCLVLP
jgi:hypothetical protein